MDGRHELVRVTTSDRLRLDGLWSQRSAAVRGVVVLLHGVGGNFYSSPLLDAFADALLDSDWAVLRANTRGHDLVSLAHVGGRMRYEGAAFETVARSTRDLAAWTELGRARVGRTVWLGHSLGAIKSLYAAVHAPEAGPDLVMALSPPRLSYSAFAGGSSRESFLEDYRRAREAVVAGRSREIMAIRFPFPLLLTPATFLDKYGPEERYNIERFVMRLTVPSLLVYGALELQEGPAFEGLVESLRGLDYEGPRPALQVISGADHFYTDRYAEVVRAVVAWLDDDAHANPAARTAD